MKLRHLNKKSRSSWCNLANLSRIVADFSFFGKGYLRNRIGLFFGLAFPLILIILFGAIFSGIGSSGPTTVYVQNFDHGSVSGQFISALNNTNSLRLVPVSTSENFSSYLSSHSSSDGLIIPSDFSPNFIAGKSVNVTVYGNPSSSSSGIVSGTVSAIINAFNLKRVGGSATIGLVQTTVVGQSYKYVDFLIPGLIGYSVLIGPMFSLVNISSLYKKTKLFKQFSLTPLSKSEWLISKILWYIFLGLISFVLMVAAGEYLFGAHVVLSVWLIPFLILGPMFFASLGMLVGTVAKSVETASVVGNVITFPMMFLSGTFFPISIMPTYLQGIAHIFPLFYVIEGLNAVMIYSNFAQAALDLLIVTVLAVGMLIAAAKLFKWRED
jgi:ABC-2 type transport system permease protein